MHNQKKNNTQVDNAKDIDIVMSMYNLMEYSDNSSNIEMNHLSVIIIIIFLILLLLIIIIVNHLGIKKKEQIKQATMARKLLT